MKVKIYGAGSIGNHLTQAARRMGWEVAVVDRDPQALVRMREEIYPSRYGAWDETVEQYELGREPKGGFDLICLGTPPDVRIPLARQLVAEAPKAILLEKPLCEPACEGLKELLGEMETADIRGFVGYDHAVSRSVACVRELLLKKAIGQILSIDVEFREHWGGIFDVHPWLSGPRDSYLGFTERGGGASGEHSHALHLWFTFAIAARIGPWEEVRGYTHMVRDKGVNYDDFASFTLETTSGVPGRVVQDVITKPTRKWARIQGFRGYIEWECSAVPGDKVEWEIDGVRTSRVFPKTRRDDFHEEMQHIAEAMKAPQNFYKASPIALSTGVSVMEVLQTVIYTEDNQLVPIERL